MSYTNQFCPNCRQPLAPGDQFCRNCQEYHRPGNVNTGIPNQSWATTGTGYNHPNEKISDFSQRPSAPKKWNKFLLVASAVVACLLLIGGFVLGRNSTQVTASKPVTQVSIPTSVPTTSQMATPVNNPTTVVTVAPTTSATSTNAQPVPSGVINENTLLQCGCDDAIRVTVNKITVDQAEGGKMIFSMTFHNISESGAYYDGNFSLEDQQGGTFTGTGSPSPYLAANQSVQSNITFTLAPVRGVPYTLNGVLNIGSYPRVNFKPAQFTF